MIGVRKIARASILAFAITVPSVNSAVASTAYDGRWSISVATESGDCGATYQFEIGVIEGTVSYQGPANVSGRVSAGGDVSVSISTQTQRASGSGKLSRTTGRGRWTGRSDTSRCSGSWTAQRQ